MAFIPESAIWEPEITTRGDPLLPPNQTPLEGAVGLARLPRVLPEIVPALWDPDNCPVRLLPWLAWSLSVDIWDETWTEEQKRGFVREALAVHQVKGTPGAVKRLLALLGHPDAVLIERGYTYARGQGHTRAESLTRGSSRHWAIYDVVLNSPITTAQANAIIASLRAAQRACCHLGTFRFRDTTIRRGQGHTRADGYTRGYITIEI
jgi:phage tail P2-like protein